MLDNISDVSYDVNCAAKVVDVDTDLPTDRPLSRAEQKTRTRRALAQAARELIGEQGYRDTTVEQIAERVGVSARTFFRHFPTKEAALFAKVEEMAEVLTGILGDRPADEAPLASVRAAMTTVAAGIQAEGRWMVEVAGMADEVPAVREHLDFRVGYMMRRTVQAWAERRLGVPSVSDPRPGLLGGLAAACADTARERWLAHSGQLSLDELMAESFDQLAGLVAPQA